MAMPYQPWRARLQPASFRGVEFKVEVDAMPTGRRNAFHEFAKRDVPFAEDMGRRGRRFTFTAYVIGPEYIRAMAALIDACEAGGSGQLVHPTLGNHTVVCDACVPQQLRERGGFCAFELVFLEAGSLDYAVSSDTQAQAGAAADDLSTTSADGIDGLNDQNQVTGDPTESFNPNAPDVDVPFNANSVEVNPSPGITAPYAGQGAISGRV